MSAEGGLGDAAVPPLLPPGDAGADAGAAFVPCPEGVSQAGRCYRAVSGPLAWADARDDCVAWGGELVRVDSAEEDALVGALLETNVWIGASDLETDGAFVWTDGSPVSFANWGPNQPDDFPGQDCVEKRQEPGEAWYDQPCGDEKSFVCERALEP